MFLSLQLYQSIKLSIHMESEKERRALPQDNQSSDDSIQFNKIYDYIEQLPKMQKKQRNSSLDFTNYTENSLAIVVQEKKEHKKDYTMYVPAYVRCHFRNMTEMDIQNLSAKFIATMNISFYLGKYEQNKQNQKQSKEKRSRVEAFTKELDKILCKNLKITFQNDFVLNMSEDISNNVSDSDRLVRVEYTPYTIRNVTRYYTNIVVTREFKFGLHSDIFFFPLEKNLLDLVTTLNSIKLKDEGNSLTVRFNCMNLEIHENEIKDSTKIKSSLLIHNLRQLYMHEHDGQELTDEILKDEFQQKNHSFFRSVKISFPLKANATEFGYYNIVEKEINIHYTNQKQLLPNEDCYEHLKNALFCKKKTSEISQDDNNQGNQRNLAPKNKEDYQPVSKQEDNIEDSYCNAIMSIPMLKASLGTIIQLCIPIFFLSFLTLVEFLYSRSTSGDQVRGQKIGASTLIVATYISFIYAMRKVIPPTPSWSIFEVAVCILAGSSILPIIESIYAADTTSVDNPFTSQNVLFIIAFIINTFLCLMIVFMLIVIKIFMYVKLERSKLNYVGMNDLLDSLTKKNFSCWRNRSCRAFMEKELSDRASKAQIKTQ